jgi:hypothetical protein
MNTRLIPSSRLTRLALATGSVLSGACFAIAVLLEVIGRDTTPGAPGDPAAIVRSVLDLGAWGWASLGTLVIIATPAVALIATILEFRAVRDHRTALTAGAVLVVLGVSVVIAALQPG